MGTPEICACGKPLHYATEQALRYMEQLVAEYGPFQKITLYDINRTFMVPRHFIALHGVTGEQIPALAFKYGWKEP